VFTGQPASQSLESDFLSLSYHQQQGKEEMVMKKLLIALVLAVVMVSATSCNTLHGAGQDIEDVGDAVKDATN
jgi:predicted small secreted protein